MTKLNPTEMRDYLADLNSQAEFLHRAGQLNDEVMEAVQDAIAVLDPDHVFEGTADGIDRIRAGAGVVLALIKTAYEAELKRSDRA